MGKQEHRVSVDNGKYTFVIPADDYRVSILRHGKPWHGPQAEACNALFAIMAELDAARVVVQAARELTESWRAGAQARLERALTQHDELVGDREPPSAWTQPATPRQSCECAGGEYGGHDIDCRNRTTT